VLANGILSKAIFIGGFNSLARYRHFNTYLCIFLFFYYGSGGDESKARKDSLEGESELLSGFNIQSILSLRGDNFYRRVWNHYLFSVLFY